LFQRHIHQACVSALILLMALVAVGCSSKIVTHPTRGKVVYKESGKPVAGGVVIWFEATEPPYHRAMSDVEADGSFSLGFIQADSGSVEGEHRVCIKPAPPILAGSAEQVLAKVMHPRYYDFQTSGLRQKIARGTNEVVIEVEGPPSR
jgi:hypothetical protein